MKRTILYNSHVKLGAKLIDFGGWEMPVQYTSISDEHLAVRNAAGLFDISHMGEVTVNGAAATEFLNHLLTNDVRKLSAGVGQYSLMCHERGGVVDDLYVFGLTGDSYFMVINASRTEADLAWMEARAAEFSRKIDLRLSDASHNYAAVALQGPRSLDILTQCFAGPSTSCKRVGKVADLKKNDLSGFTWRSVRVMISRTGYTGEDGYEIYGRAESIVEIWEALLTAGAPMGLKPCGLGARDTLRTEACYPLYGHELDENTTPIEAGLGIFVALDKGEFCGRSVLAAQKDGGTSRKLVAFKMTEKCPVPRPEFAIWRPGSDPSPIGRVTSGTQSPSLGMGIGMGYVPPELAKADTRLEIEIRGKRYPAVVVRKPIYRRA